VLPASTRGQILPKLRCVYESLSKQLRIFDSEARSVHTRPTGAHQPTYGIGLRQGEIDFFGAGGVLARNRHYRQLHDLKLGRYDVEDVEELA
jgi:hypothetical protein